MLPLAAMIMAAEWVAWAATKPTGSSPFRFYRLVPFGDGAFFGLSSGAGVGRGEKLKD